jgi:hypothetical protein
LSKVSREDLVALGLAVKRALSLKGLTLDQAGALVKPEMGKSLLSKIVNGRKETLSGRTVGRLIEAFDLDESWIEKFVFADDSGDADGEARAEEDADRIMDRVTRENLTEGASEDLLIQLATTYTQGNYRDRETAYVGVRNALIAYAEMRDRGALPGNADAHFAAVMNRVTKLNNQGHLDEADALLEAEERLLLADLAAERERQAEAQRQMLEQRLNQDRLRNDPSAAADRLIRDLLRQAPAGGVFRATQALIGDWRRRGETQGDPFDLRVALTLAIRNLPRAKGSLKADALYQLGVMRWQIGERLTGSALLEKAEEVLRAAIRAIPQNEPLALSNPQTALGCVLSEIARREWNFAKMQEAVRLHRSVLALQQKHGPIEAVATAQNNLGISLQFYGEITRDADALRQACDLHLAALQTYRSETMARDWAMSQNNLGLSRRWLGSVTADSAQFDLAAGHYANCLTVWTRSTLPFLWAMTEWNLADLVLARHLLRRDPVLLEKAELHATAARKVFAEGSDYHTARCDDLLHRIEAERL